MLLGVNISVDELRPFINKCKTLRNLANVGRCLQIFVADGYEREALALAKEAGVVPATTETLFGLEVAKALRQLTDVLKDVYPREGTLGKVDEVFSRLSHIEGAATNLRGALFEFVVAEIERTNSPHTSIQLNEILRDQQGKSVEVDVLIFHSNHSVRFIECKGYKPGGTVPDDMVERWLEDRIPLIRSIAGQDRSWRNCEMIFEFWTSGRLSMESKAMIQAKIGNIRRFKLRILESQEIANIVKQTNSTSLKKVYGDHFLDHPLETAERASKKSKRQLTIPPNSQAAYRKTSK